MSANDWRERQKGIVRLQEMCQSSPNIVNANLVKVAYRHSVNYTPLQVYNSILQTMSTCISHITTNFISYVLHYLQIFDHYVPTLKDSNSKVNLFSLQVLCQITPCIKDNISNMITLILQNVSGNLSSKNKDIHVAATEVLDAFMEFVGKICHLLLEHTYVTIKTHLIIFSNTNFLFYYHLINIHYFFQIRAYCCNHFVPFHRQLIVELNQI